MVGFSLCANKVKYKMCVRPASGQETIFQSANECTIVSNRCKYGIMRHAAHRLTPFGWIFLFFFFKSCTANSGRQDTRHPTRRERTFPRQFPLHACYDGTAPCPLTRNESECSCERTIGFHGTLRVNCLSPFKKRTTHRVGPGRS